MVARPAALMLQGTGSDVGKSLIAAGLCCAFRRRGLGVRPFKPQNLSNNAAVTADGGEIGRAQALQARACGVEPVSDMNPVLLKPQGAGCQLIVQGQVWGAASAGGDLRPILLPRVLQSFHRLAAAADLVVVEGAGSAAELNLRAADIANMGFAEAADVPVVLIADVERGGTIAAIVGTHALLSEAERRRVKGYIVNKFRGDPALFAAAVEIIGQRTGWTCFGIVPWFTEAASLPDEDVMALENMPDPANGPLGVVVPRLPHIANFDEFDPLAAEPWVALRFAMPGRPLPEADLIVLPGSKATISDLAFLRAEGWDIDILAHVRRGGRVLGICAGYQMLGRMVRDPYGIEGEVAEASGIGLLDVETIIGRHKTLRHVVGHDAHDRPLRGYEMHMGTTTGPDTARPLLHIDGRGEGAVSADGRVAGCYVHGLFAADDWRRWYVGVDSAVTYEAMVEGVLDRLAQHLESHLDVAALLAVARA